MEIYDLAIVGQQLVGAGASYLAASSGLKVIGFEKFTPPHTFGSSHGESRIYRLAIGEGMHNTPFAKRSYSLFRELENFSGMEIINPVGCLIMASENDESSMHGKLDFIGETRRAANDYEINHKILDTSEIHSLYPQFNLVGDEVGYYEPGAGFLRPENAIRAELKLAREYGADIHIDEEVMEICPRNDDVRIKTNKGEYLAGKVILAAGSWMYRFFLPEFRNLFQIHRQIVYYFDILDNRSSYLPENFPTFIWQRDGKFIYGFPAINGLDGGIKVASESVDPIHPDFNREPSYAEIKNFHNEQIENYFPDLAPACLKAIACKYTNTPDRQFIVDYHPDSRNNVIVASVDSGHGAKHSLAISEAVVELVLNGATRLDISPYKLSRFTQPF